MRTWIAIAVAVAGAGAAALLGGGPAGAQDGPRVLRLTSVEQHCATADNGRRGESLARPRCVPRRAPRTRTESGPAARTGPASTSGRRGRVRLLRGGEPAWRHGSGRRGAEPHEPQEHLGDHGRNGALRRSTRNGGPPAGEPHQNGRRSHATSVSPHGALMKRCHRRSVRALIVEDEPKMAALIQRGLPRRATPPTSPRTRRGRALDGARRPPYDAIVLDVMLPGHRRLRGLPAAARRDGVWAPVLMLTARDAVEDRVAGPRHAAPTTT